MNSEIYFAVSIVGFVALFAAIWILHRPLNVHACPQKLARVVHSILEWILTAWAICLLGYAIAGFLCAGPPVEDRAINRNQAAMRLFEKCINTNDLELGRKLIADTAAFDTPVSPTPLYGAEGYLSVVSLMRKSFPDVQWKLVDMVADEKAVAVQWECSGTFSGEAPFAGLQPNGRRFSTTVMNFYSFDADGKIYKDVAAVGIAGILQGIGALP